MTAAEKDWPQQLATGLQALGLAFSGAQRDALLRYLRLLGKWNRAYNLTAVRDPGVVVPRHLLDSLTVLPFLAGPRVLDVGTGPGLPGIPLAVARPDWRFVLLDSNGKKTRFVQQARQELALANVEVVRARVEQYAVEPLFDSIVSRAFARLGDMVRLTGHLLREDGRWVAMKGPAEASERADLPTGFAVTSRAVRVPGLPGDHRVVVLRRR